MNRSDIVKISDYIRERVILPRLHDKQVLVLYDEKRRYHEVARTLSSPGIRLIDASESILEARESAMEVLIERGRRPEKADLLIVYVPAAPPADEDASCSDFFSALAATGDRFPKGDSDTYLDLCLSAKPEFGGRIRELFQGREPSFAAVDAVGASGGDFPRLKTELGCESAAETLTALMLPKEDQAEFLKRTGSCRKEALGFLETIVGFQPKERTASWVTIGDELWRFVLFSEFVFDLPSKLPESLTTVTVAAEDKKDLIYRVCEQIRSVIPTRSAYVERAERIAEELDLESEMADVRDLGQRDTFSFEERSFLATYIDAVKSGNLSDAESIAEGRKTSVWVQESGRQLLWTLAERALNLIRRLDDHDRDLSELGNKTESIISFYADRGYSLDQAYRHFEETFCEIDEDSEDIDRLVERCRDRYRKSVDRLQRIFIDAVRKSGWPVQGISASGSLFDEQVKPLLTKKDARVAVLWVDALRYELGVALENSLSSKHKTTLDVVSAALPSITEVGMASLLPSGRELKLTERSGIFSPNLDGYPVETAQARVARF